MASSLWADTMGRCEGRELMGVQAGPCLAAKAFATSEMGSGQGRRASERRGQTYRMSSLNASSMQTASKKIGHAAAGAADDGEGLEVRVSCGLS